MFWSSTPSGRISGTASKLGTSRSTNGLPTCPFTASRSARLARRQIRCAANQGSLPESFRPLHDGAASLCLQSGS